MSRGIVSNIQFEKCFKNELYKNHDICMKIYQSFQLVFFAYIFCSIRIELHNYIVCFGRCKIILRNLCLFN